MPNSNTQSTKTKPNTKQPKKQTNTKPKRKPKERQFPINSTTLIFD